MISKQPSRKTRTKLRKPKYLSLRFQLTAAKPPPPPPPPPQPPMPTTTKTTSDHSEQKQLINLFPLHPENLVEQLFSSCDDVDKAATTLTGILCSDDDDDDDEDDDVNTNNKPSPSSVNYVDHEVELVRTAMRRNKTERNNENDYNNGDDDDDEKWVCYSDIRGMSSSSSSTTRTMTSCCDRRKKLVLKLDYDKIMKSWVNKGPLFVRGDSGLGSGMGMDGSLLPQTVPELCDDDFFLPSLCVNGSRHDEQDNGGGSWTVPEMRRTENNSVSKGDDALQAMESSAMMHNREASVQRYKEKRRNRLFAKTIRYEVRKLNAEKRPRIKGRFVKRN